MENREFDVVDNALGKLLACGGSVAEAEGHAGEFERTERRAKCCEMHVLRTESELVKRAFDVKQRVDQLAVKLVDAVVEIRKDISMLLRDAVEIAIVDAEPTRLGFVKRLFDNDERRCP